MFNRLVGAAMGHGAYFLWWFMLGGHRVGFTGFISARVVAWVGGFRLHMVVLGFVGK